MYAETHLCQPVKAAAKSCGASSVSCEILFYLDNTFFWVEKEDELYLWPHFLQDENTGQQDYKDKAGSATVLYIETK